MGIPMTNFVVYLKDTEDTGVKALTPIHLIDNIVVRVYLETSTAEKVKAPIYINLVAAAQDSLRNGEIYFDYQGNAYRFNRRASFNFVLNSIYTVIRKLW